MKTSQLIALFQHATNNSTLALIEGAQALKHAVRFEAEIEHIVTCDMSELQVLMDKLAPDISSVISPKITEVDTEAFAKISPKNHRTKVVTLAKRKLYSVANIDNEKPIVFLEDPKDLENIGAVIRVTAAADAGAVITDAKVSVWHPAVIRGAAGLHYAVPVFNLTLSSLMNQFPDRTVVSLHPEGGDFHVNKVPRNAILIFGTERHGIKAKTLEGSDEILRLKMKEGVSSLNLATSVAATLYQMS